MLKVRIEMTGKEAKKIAEERILTENEEWFIEVVRVHIDKYKKATDEAEKLNAILRELDAMNVDDFINSKYSNSANRFKL